MSGAVAGESFVEVGGNRLHVAVDGREDGPWLTLLNSLAADMRMWEPQIAPLGAAFRLLRIDARGHGGSTAANPAASIDDLAADVVAVWDALRIARSHLLGLSLGGMTGIGVALNHPSRIDRLVAADCRADAPPLLRRDVGQAPTDAPRERHRQGGRRDAVDLVFRSDAEGETAHHRGGTRHDRRHVRGGLHGCEPGPAEARLQAQTARTELSDAVPGRSTGRPPPAKMRSMALVPGAEFVELADAAHISNLEEPERFTAAVLRFLRA